MAEEEKKDLENQEPIEEEILLDDEQEEEGEGFDVGKGYGQQYDQPEDRDAFVDADKGTVIDKGDISPFEQIKIVAEKMDLVVNDPKPSCKKCYGRGYTGIEFTTQSPIPCSCIYPPKTEIEKQNEERMSRQFTKPGRWYKRKMKRVMMKQIKSERKKGKLKEMLGEIVDEAVKQIEPEDLETMEAKGKDYIDDSENKQQ